MKNIHLIPTEKPSRLLKFANQLIFDKETEVKDKRNQNIYITSDEEIKEGDWVIYNNEIQKSDGISFKSVDKKIILTTDQDLIKNGVQAIDDEFLEWFVNNSNCEEVEVIIEQYTQNYHKDIWYNRYKIIIPTLEQKLENIVSKQPSKFWEESDERVKERETSIEHHQELFNYLNNELNAIALQSQMFEIEAIVLKAQKEQMYSEEDMINFANLYSDIDINDSHLKYFNNLPRFKKEIR